MTSVDTQIRNCSQIINFGFLSNCDQCTWPRKYLVPGFNHIVQGQEILKKAVCKYLQNDNSKHTLFLVLFGKHNLFLDICLFFGHQKKHFFCIFLWRHFSGLSPVLTPPPPPSQSICVRQGIAPNLLRLCLLLLLLPSPGFAAPPPPPPSLILPQTFLIVLLCHFQPPVPKWNLWLQPHGWKLGNKLHYSIVLEGRSIQDSFLIFQQGSFQK